MRFRALGLGFVAAATGCGGLVDPSADLSRAEQSLRQAEQEGARDDLGAGLYFALAAKELGQAQERLGLGDWDAARGFAVRADADAEVALLVTREAGTRDAAQRTADLASSLAADLEAAEPRALPGEETK
jgi:hypothetical protein